MQGREWDRWDAFDRKGDLVVDEGFRPLRGPCEDDPYRGSPAEEDALGEDIERGVTPFQVRARREGERMALEAAVRAAEDAGRGRHA